MDFLLIRRKLLTAPTLPFLCACGRPVTWKFSEIPEATCARCDQPQYILLRDHLTPSGSARECVIVARGVVIEDRPQFEAQGFHVVPPPLGARFFADVPTIMGELTNEDGSLKVEIIPK